MRKKASVISDLRKMIEQEVGDRLKPSHLHRIERDGGPSYATLHGWFFGTTLEPKDSDVEKTGRALGYRRAWVKEEN